MRQKVVVVVVVVVLVVVVERTFTNTLLNFLHFSFGKDRSSSFLLLTR